MTRKVFILAITIVFQSLAFAQGNEPLSPDDSNSTSSSSTKKSTWDRFQPGWNPNKFKKSVGFSTTFLSSTSAITYEEYSDDQASWTYLLGLSKSSDSYTPTSSTTTSGTTTITTTSSTTYSGSKNPYAIGIGTIYSKKIFRNEWIFLRLGVFGGIDYYTNTSYQSGTKSEVSTSTSPETTNISETNYGKVDVTRGMPIRMGPVIDSTLFLRWFPQIGIGFQAAMLYSTGMTTKTKSSLCTKSYSVVSGVEQSPTSLSCVEQTSESIAGPSLSTFAVAGSTFNLFGSFTIKYVW